MRRIVVALALLAGCDQLFNFDTVSARDASSVDAVDAPDARSTDAGQVCIGGFYFLVCYVDADVIKDLTVLPNDTLPIDTSVDAECTQIRPGMPEACIVIAHGIDINTAGTLRATGTRSLVLVSTTDITITGIVDASSRLNDPPGPAYDSGACALPDTLAGAAQPMSLNHAGGGAGGSFVGAGGPGGGGEGGVVTLPQGSVDATTLHGGCPGGPGGVSLGGVQAPGGHGGGAIYIIARGTILVTGKVLAEGEGGHARPGTGPGDFPGGGGGGAGGLIALDADKVATTSGAALVASGGGGGGGANGTTSGMQGGDGVFGGGTGGVGAPGGAGSTGGDGGSGSTRASPSGVGGTAGGTIQGGGGGGGGGAGVIHLHGRSGVMNNAVAVSPQPS